MILKTDYAVLENALHTWGFDNQIGMVHEELGELLTAINQWKRGRVTKEQLASEVADAFIMVSQMAVIVGYGQVQDLIEYKTDRLKQRLVDYNAPKGPGIRKV